MGGYGMGPGMMGGYGMGPGMMGGGMGYGHGPGYGMGYGPGYGLAGLNLTDEQRKNVNKLLDGQQKVHHNAMGKIMEQNSRLRDLYSQEKWDANAIAAAYDEISKQRSVMIRSRIDTRNKIYDLLTPQQRQQFRRSSEPVPES
jgi:Spy/CpxP family protein refolding chaperone